MSAAIVFGVAAALVLVGTLTTAIDAQPPVSRFGRPLTTYDISDRIRMWANGSAGTPAILAILAVVATTIASPRPGPGRPNGTALALGLALGCAAVATLVLLYDLAIGPAGGRTVGHAFGRLASIVLSGTAAWWALAALRPLEPARRGPPGTAGPPVAPGAPVS